MENMNATSAATLAKIEQLRLDLCREFPGVGGEQVRERMDRSVDELLRQATFDDFVPLLAYRHVRDGIRDAIVSTDFVPRRDGATA
jgi:hypothetical protein